LLQIIASVAVVGLHRALFVCFWNCRFWDMSWRIKYSH